MQRSFVLTGRYEVDKEHSGSLYSHMKALGCDEIAALASEKLRIIINIVQTKTEIHFWQSSQLGDTKRVLLLDRETDEGDERKATVTFSESGMEIFTTFPKGTLKDERSFAEDGSGDVVQQLELTVGSEAPLATKRLLKRLGAPDPEVTRGFS